MISPGLLAKTAEIINQLERVLLVAHEDPDGDGLASALALKIALGKLGKEAAVVCRDPVPAVFEFLPEAQTVTPDFLLGDWQTVVVLDCGDLKRTGFPERIREFAKIRRRLINIDHHPRNDLQKLANLNLVDPQAAATGEIVYELLKVLGVEFDAYLATALLTALYTDTGGFKHANTSPHTLSIAAKLLTKGARPRTIARQIANSKTVAALRLWGVALSRMRLSSSGLISSFLTQKDLEKSRATEASISGIVNLLNAVPEGRAAVLFFETGNGTVKCSLRTEDEKVDVSRLAELFGGGGHKRAAGFVLPGRLVLTREGRWRIEEAVPQQAVNW